jgi:hypothetical protein
MNYLVPIKLKLKIFIRFDSLSFLYNLIKKELPLHFDGGTMYIVSVSFLNTSVIQRVYLVDFLLSGISRPFLAA